MFAHVHVSGGMPPVRIISNLETHMKHVFQSLLSCALLLACTLVARAQEQNEMRLWTSKVGTTTTARLISANPDSATLERPDGTTIRVPLVSLSLLDQQYVGARADSAPAKTSPIEAKTPPAAPPLPENFPKDEISDTIPWLRELKSRPIAFEFTDYATKQKKTQEFFRGKYVYIHTGHLSRSFSIQLTQLKLLHAKYGDKGVAFITVLHPPQTYYAQTDDFKNKKEISDFLDQLVKDYGVEWSLSYADSGSENPLAKKIARERNFQWLIGPDGKLVHSRVLYERDYYSRDGFLNLNRALGLIFGETVIR